MVTTSEGKSLFSKVDQIGIVVKDLEKYMKFYEKLFGVEPFPTVESTNWFTEKDTLASTSVTFGTTRLLRL